MQQLPRTDHPLVIRTAFENQQSWDAICECIRAPQFSGSDAFYAHADLLNDREFENLNPEDFLARLPSDYPARS